MTERSARFTFTLNAPAPVTASLQWKTVDGTAVAPDDYVAATGTLVFPKGSTSASFTVRVLGDSAAPVAKSFTIATFSPVNLSVAVGTMAKCVVSKGDEITLSIEPQVISLGVYTAGTLVTTGTPTTPTTPDPVTPTPPTTTLSWLTATGSVLKDASGAVFIPKSINWYGFEQAGIPQGLEHQPWRTITVGGVVREGILNAIKRLGYNSIRLLVCEDCMMDGWGPSATPPAGGANVTYIDPALNPEFFVGTPAYQNQVFKTSKAIMHLIVDECDKLGLRVIADLHCLAPNTSDQAGNAPMVNGSSDFTKKLWYTTATRTAAGATAHLMNELRNEQQCLDFWQTMASEFRLKPAMAGFDFINEPAGGTWDTDPAANLNTNLPSFYERAAAVVQAADKGNNPNVLIVCEGAAGNVDYGQTAAGEPCVWGTVWSGNLQNVANRRVGTGIASLTGKVVYSPHEYFSYGGEAFEYCPASFKAGAVPKGFAHQWFYDPTFPANMPNVWDKAYGFIVKQGIAPVWPGEVGAELLVQGATGGGSPNYTNDNLVADKLVIQEYAAYLKANGMGLAIWSLNPGGTPRGLLSRKASTSGGALDTWDLDNPNAIQKTYYDMLLNGTVPAARSLAVYYDVFACWGDVPTIFNYSAASPSAARVKETRLSKIPTYVDKVMLFAAKPDCSYVAGSLNTVTAANFQAQTALGWNADPLDLKAAIALLKARSPAVKVLLSVGGAGAEVAPPATTGWAGYNPAACVALMNDIGCDGILLDYEPYDYNFFCTTDNQGARHCVRPNGVDMDARVRGYVSSTRALIPKSGGKLLELYGSSTACYHGTWATGVPAGSNSGNLVQLSQSAEGAMLDAVHLGAYDASSDFDPKTALDSYLAYWPNTPVYLGTRSRGDDTSDHSNRYFTQMYLRELALHVQSKGANAKGMEIYAMNWEPNPLSSPRASTYGTPVTLVGPNPYNVQQPTPGTMAQTIAAAFRLPSPATPLWDDTRAVPLP